MEDEEEERLRAEEEAAREAEDQEGFDAGEDVAEDEPLAEQYGIDDERFTDEIIEVLHLQDVDPSTVAGASEQERDEILERARVDLARQVWRPSSSPPDAVQALAVEEGEPAWWLPDDEEDAADQLGFGVTAWDQRLGGSAGAVCAWIEEEMAGVGDDAILADPAEPDEQRQRLQVVLMATPEIDDGLMDVAAERCLE